MFGLYGNIFSDGVIGIGTEQGFVEVIVMMTHFNRRFKVEAVCKCSGYLQKTTPLKSVHNINEHNRRFFRKTETDWFYDLRSCTNQ